MSHGHQPRIRVVTITGDAMVHAIVATKNDLRQLGFFTQEERAAQTEAEHCLDVLAASPLFCAEIARNLTRVLL